MPEPVSTDTPAAPISVDSNLKFTSPDQQAEIGKAMDEFFDPPKEEVVKDEPKPKTADRDAAPSKDGPAKEEPKKVAKKPTDKATEKVVPDRPADAKKEVVKPEEKAAPSEDEDEPDEEVDGFKLKNATPESEGHFKELKKVTKVTKAEAKAFRENLSPLAKEMGIEFSNNPKELRAQVEQLATRAREVLQGRADPEELKAIKAERDQYQQIVATHKLGTDSHFNQTYRDPVQKAFEAAITEAVEAAPASQRGPMTQWAEQIKKAGLDQLTDDFWTKNVINVMPDDFAKTRVSAKVVQLLEAKRNLKTALEETGKPENYKKYQDEVNSAYVQRYQEGIAKFMAPIQAKHEWTNVKDPATAKNAEERKAFEAHNEKQSKYDKLYREALIKESTQEPQDHASVAWDLVRTQYELDELQGIKERAEEAEERAEKAEEELEKIRRARGIPGRANGVQPKSSGKPVLKATSKVDDAFKAFDWGTN